MNLLSLKSYFLFCSVMLVLISCKKEKFTLEDAAETYFHVNCEDYIAPVMVRGNTASKKIILYIQGGPGLNTLDFAITDYPEWKNTLEEEFAVVYYDQRGTGNHQNNFDMESVSIDSYIDDLHHIGAFLKEAYGAEITFMGHSFGGILIYHYLLKYGDNGVAANYITLNSPATSDEDQIRWEFRRDYLYYVALEEIDNGTNVTAWNEVLDWLEAHPLIQKLEGTDDPWKDIRQWNTFVEELILYRYPLKNVGVGDYIKVLFASPYNPFPAYTDGKVIEEVQNRLFEDMHAAKLIERLDQIKQPMLLITGRHDDICPPEELAYMLEHLGSNANEGLVLENASHDSFLHQKDQFFTAIKNYIQ